jgi:hypothetical protein
MASRPIKMIEKDDKEIELSPPAQQKRPEKGRYLLQVDRQTKGSYGTLEAAEIAGKTIKQSHPFVQVTVYDRIESQTTLVPS